MSIMQLATSLSGQKEEDVMQKDNRINAFLMLCFMIAGLALVIYQTLKYKKFMLGVPASVHGVETDALLYWNFAIIGVVFFATHIVMFWYIYKYQYKKGAKAFFFHESVKIEVIWTVIPAIVLITIIFFGLRVWNNITMSDTSDGMRIQIYGKQFDWTARYAGKDNKLGRFNYRLISDVNPLGVDSTDKAAADDQFSRTELHFPVNVPIMLEINAQDVLHSAYFPHFRVQMNAVPGMTTSFYFTPTITTERMREILGNPKFDYILLCNKICGVAHYNMKMKVVVDTQEDFKKWLRGEKPVFEKPKTDSKVVEAYNAGNNSAANVVALM
jgi:cytochrome c oxidase subunit 2